MSENGSLTMAYTADEMNVYLVAVREQLQVFLLDPSFEQKIQNVFGAGVVISQARSLIEQFIDPLALDMPCIEFVSADELDFANGAYAAATDTIYLSAGFIQENADNIESITAVFLEELGHALDARLNTSDTLGDEGELFSLMVRGVALTATATEMEMEMEMERITCEDDSAVISMKGEDISVEQSNITIGLLQGYNSWNDSISYFDYGDNWIFSISLVGESDDAIVVSSNSAYVDIVLELYDQNNYLIQRVNDFHPGGSLGNVEGFLLEGLPYGTYRACVYDDYSGYYLYTFGKYSANYTIEFQAPEIVKDTFENNNSFLSATSVSEGDLVYNCRRFLNLSIDSQNDYDYFKFTTSRIATDNDMILSLVNGVGDIDLALRDSSDNLIYSTTLSSDGSGLNAIPLAGLFPGTYYLIAGSNEHNVTPSYNLLFSLPQDITADKYDTPNRNDSFATGTDLASVTGFRRETGLSIHQSSDVDWYKFQLSGQTTNQHYLKIDFDGAMGDLDIALYNSANQLIDCSNGFEDAESISLAGLTAGAYYLKVSGFLGDTNDYQLTINAPGVTNAISTDIFESGGGNNTRTKATVLASIESGWQQGVGEHAWENLSIGSNDQDWFKLTLTAGGSYGNYVAALFDTTKGDLDLELYTETGTTALLQSAGFRNAEKIDLNGVSAGTYYVRVVGYQGANNPNYTLTLNVPGSDPYENNDNQADAKLLTRSTVQQTWANLSMDDVGDWYTFNLPVKGSANDSVRIDFSHVHGDLDLQICGSDGSVISGRTSSGVGNSEQVSLDGLAAGSYKIRAFGFNGAHNPSYSLTIDAPVASNPDRFESNNTQATATNLNAFMQAGSDVIQLGLASGQPLSIESASDVDWFKFSLASDGRSGDYAALSLDHTAGDLDLYLYNSSNQLIGKSEGVSNLHAIDLNGFTKGTYYLKVFGYAPSGGTAATNSSYGLSLKAPLSTEGPDWAEGNNDALHAKDLGTVSSSYEKGNLSILDGDVDWFKFHLGGTGEAGNAVGIRFNNRQGDLDLALYAADRTTLLDSSTGVANEESISLNSRPAGDYYLKVYGYANAANPEYTLFINPPRDTQGDWAEGSAGNNTASNARDLRNVDGLQTWDTLSIHQSSDVDWFKFTTLKTADASDYVQITYDQTQGDLDLYLYDSTGATLLGKSETTEGLEQIKLSTSSGAPLAQGTYLVKVMGYHNATNPVYQLSINAPDSNPADWAEGAQGNNAPANATNLQVVEGAKVFSGLSIDHGVDATHTTADIDYFSFKMSGTGGHGHSVSIECDHTQGDLTLEIVDINGNRITGNATGVGVSNTVGTDRETISLEGLQKNQTYYVKVSGATNTTTNPSYSLVFDTPQAPEADFTDGTNNRHDTRQTAYDLRQVSGTLEVSALSIDSTSDQDWFKFTLEKDAASGEKIRIDCDRFEGKLTMELFDSNGNSLGASSIANEDFAEIALVDKVEAGKVYYIKIAGKDGVTNPEYSLTVTGTPLLSEDAYEKNDTPGDATDLRDLADFSRSSIARSSFSPMAVVSAMNSAAQYSPAIASYLPYMRQDAFNLPNYGSSVFNSYIGHGYDPAIQSMFSNLSNDFDHADSLSAIGSNLGLGGPSNYVISSSGNYFNLGNATNFTTTPSSTLSNTSFSSPTGSNSVSNHSNQNTLQSYSSTDLLSAIFLLSYLMRGSSDLPSASISDLSIDKSTDQDWFKFELTSDGIEGQYVGIRFGRIQGALKLELFENFDPEITTTEINYAKHLVEVTEAGGSDLAQISLAGLAKGTYYIRVSGVDGATNPNYSLELNAPPQPATGGDWAEGSATEGNQSAATAYDLRFVEGGKLLTGLSIHAVNDQDWFRFTTLGTGHAGDKVRIDFENSCGDLDLALCDTNGNVLKTSTTTDNYEEINLQGLGAGTYTIHVYGYENAVNPQYTMSIVAPETTVSPDNFEPNNSFATAYNLELTNEVTAINGTIHTGDEDYFKFTTTAKGTSGNSLSVQFDAERGDLQLFIYDKNHALLPTTATGSGGNETISLENFATGTYYAKISGADANTANAYQLHIDAPTNTDTSQAQNDWTVFVYITGSTLAPFAFADINEMEMATSWLPSNVNFAVLWDQSSLAQTYATGGGAAWGDTRSSIIVADTNLSMVATPFADQFGEKNTGTPTTLEDYIRWGVEAAPANHYALVMWDHGGGTLGGFNLDNEGNDQDTSADRLYTSEFASALSSLENAGLDNLDLVAFDACLMANVEVCYALQNHTDIVVASEESIGGAGFDYATAFSALISDPESSAATLASGIVDSYQQQYPDAWMGTLSAVETDKFGAFVTALKNFVNKAVALTDSATWNLLCQARAASTDYSSVYCDLGQFLDNVRESSVVGSALYTASKSAYDALQATVIDRTADPRQSQGLSIYLPESGAIAAQYFSENQSFLAATDWDDFLNAFLTRPTIRTLSTQADWAEANDMAARAYNLHTLVGDGHSFTKLTLDTKTDVDWFRFEITETGVVDDQVLVKYDAANGTRKLELALYSLDNKETPRVVSRSGTGQEVVSLKNLVKGEYLISVKNTGSVNFSDYLIEVNAPGVVTDGTDWASGNKSTGKARDLGLITTEKWFTGLHVDSANPDWFHFEVPKNQTSEPGSLYVRVAGNQAVSVELFLDDGSEEGQSLDVQSGTGTLQLDYSPIAGQKYYCKVSVPQTVTQSETITASYSLDFVVAQSNLEEDTTAPTVSSFNPADGATGVAATSNIVLTFSEAIQRGAGSISLKTADGATVETFDASTSSRLSISGNTLTIDPTATLASNTRYFVNVVAGAIQDLAGNNSTGIGTYDFITSPIVYGTLGNDTLTGGPENNTLIGYGGNDTLDGGNGADTMLGGSGNDTYYVDDAGDVVTETRWRRDRGLDTVCASIDWTLGTNCENLTLTGAAQRATGNRQWNILIGNDLDNTLDGQAGADTMHGGLGNDTYIVDKLSDVTIETSTDPAEIDTVRTSVNRTLGANLENLTLIGTRAINGAGNNLDNILIGNNSENKLRGAGGNDTLTGGGGQDTFYFDTALDDSTNVDTITDFTVGEDLLRLDRSIFTNLIAGFLSSDTFLASSTGQAMDGNDYLLYNTSTGDLLYDADGNGAGATVTFATLKNVPNLTAASCLVAG